MAKLCRAIRPPCGTNEPPPAEASSCLDTDTDTRHYEASALGGSFAPQYGPVAPQVLFCRPIGPLSNQKYRVVLNKRGGGP